MVNECYRKSVDFKAKMHGKSVGNKLILYGKSVKTMI